MCVNNFSNIKNVFLDTNIYQKKNFQFNKYELNTIKEFSERKLLTLLVSPIVNQEVKLHISEEVQAAASLIKKLKKGAKILRNTPEISQYSIFNNFDEIVAKNTVIDSFNKFISESKAVEIPYDKVSVEKIFEDYFSKQSPFSERKKKEFPDSFILNSLYNWAVNNNEKIVVISGDNDFEEFCQSHSDRLVYSKDITSFINILFSQLSQTTKLFEVAEEAYGKLESIIDIQIKSTLSSLDFTSSASDIEDEVEDIDVEEIYVTGSDLIDIKDDKAIYHLSIEARIKAFHHYYDYDRSVWDSEDKVYAYIATTMSTMIHTEDLTAYVEINLRSFEISKLEFENNIVELDFSCGEVLHTEEHFE